MVKKWNDEGIPDRILKNCHRTLKPWIKGETMSDDEDGVTMRSPWIPDEPNSARVKRWIQVLQAHAPFSMLPGWKQERGRCRANKKPLKWQLHGRQTAQGREREWSHLGKRSTLIFWIRGRRAPRKQCPPVVIESMTKNTDHELQGSKIRGA